MRIGLGISIGGRGGADPQAALIALLNAAGGYSAFHDYRTATLGTDFVSQDLTALNNDHTRIAATSPTVSSSLGAEFDGTTRIDQVINGGTYTITLLATKTAGSTVGSIIAGTASGTSVQYASGVTTALTGVSVDGVAMATRDALFLAMNDGLPHVVSIQGLDMTAQTTLVIGRASVALVGSILKCAVLHENNLTTAGTLAQARTLAAQAVLA